MKKPLNHEIDICEEYEERARDTYRSYMLDCTLDLARYMTILKTERLIILLNKLLARINLELGLAKQLSQTSTPPTTITLSTLRTSAAIFRRAGTLA